MGSHAHTMPTPPSVCVCALSDTLKCHSLTASAVPLCVWVGVLVLLLPGMYASYFILFFALFQQLYLAKSRQAAPKSSSPKKASPEPAAHTTKTTPGAPEAATPGVTLPEEEAATPFTGWAGKQVCASCRGRFQLFRLCVLGGLRWF